MTQVIKRISNIQHNKAEVHLNPLANIFFGCAFLMLVIGSSIGIYEWHTNNIDNQRAAMLVNEANHNINHIVPSTTKLTSKKLASYVVAPTLPRYLIIPKLGIDAPILSVGVNVDGSLGTPDNVFDAAWYNQSVQPGQFGAMLVDGHISSWTTHGVFYGLNSLSPGDIIDVEVGNGAIFTYRVVKTQVYATSNFDMKAALLPINPTKPGLNLISCTGDVIAGTSEFNERIMVFASFE